MFGREGRWRSQPNQNSHLYQACRYNMVNSVGASDWPASLILRELLLEASLLAGLLQSTNQLYNAYKDI